MTEAFFRLGYPFDMVYQPRAREEHSLAADAIDGSCAWYTSPDASANGVG